MARDRQPRRRGPRRPRQPRQIGPVGGAGLKKPRRRGSFKPGFSNAVKHLCGPKIDNVSFISPMKYPYLFFDYFKQNILLQY